MCVCNARLLKKQKKQNMNRSVIDHSNLLYMTDTAGATTGEAASLFTLFSSRNETEI